MERPRKVKFSVEVRSGTTRFRVGVQAQSHFVHQQTYQVAA